MLTFVSFELSVRHILAFIILFFFFLVLSVFQHFIIYVPHYLCLQSPLSSFLFGERVCVRVSLYVRVCWTHTVFWKLKIVLHQPLCGWWRTKTKQKERKYGNSIHQVAEKTKRVIELLRNCCKHPSIHHQPLIRSQVAGTAASAASPTLSFPQSRRLTLIGESPAREQM